MMSASVNKVLRSEPRRRRKISWAVTVGIAADLTVVGCIIYDWATDPSKHLSRGDLRGFNFLLALMVTSFLWTVGAIIAWRVNTLLTIYAMGYRHGKADATTALIEADMWISHSRANIHD